MFPVFTVVICAVLIRKITQSSNTSNNNKTKMVKEKELHYFVPAKLPPVKEE